MIRLLINMTKPGINIESLFLNIFYIQKFEHKKDLFKIFYRHLRLRIIMYNVKLVVPLEGRQFILS